MKSNFGQQNLFLFFPLSKSRKLSSTQLKKRSHITSPRSDIISSINIVFFCCKICIVRHPRLSFYSVQPSPVCFVDGTH